MHGQSVGEPLCNTLGADGWLATTLCLVGICVWGGGGYMPTCICVYVCACVVCDTHNGFVHGCREWLAANEHLPPMSKKGMKMKNPEKLAASRRTPMVGRYVSGKIEYVRSEVAP
jgi:hypothetical protein